VEAATTDRIQRMIDAEAAERFPPGAVPRVVLLRYGDHLVIEPGELYLLVIPGQDGAARDAWMAEHFDRLEDFRAQRLPEVKGFMVTTGARDSAGLPPTRIMQMDGISLLDPEEDEIARGLTPVPEALLGPADLATLDTLITAGIAASRAEAARWALARIREQPAYAQLSGRAREPGEPQLRADLDRAALDQLQTRLEEQVKEHFPGGGVQRVALLQHGDDPSVEPGDLLARVFIEEAGENPNLPAWHRDHETMIGDLQRELAQQLPGASHLEFWFGENGRQGKSRHRLGSPPDDPASRERDLTPADIRLGPADLEMLDALITTGTTASRAEAVSWVLARIRERPAYARLTERARELDELKTRF
jgi:Arc/MetJ-type ribon-helix-helix transcriptional regulator